LYFNYQVDGCSRMVNLIKTMCYLTFVALLIQYSCQSHAMEEKKEYEEPTNTRHQRMRFKIGFEFQESNGLCGWAKNDFSIQKKALFNTYRKGSKKPSWHVVIDGDDIEFVTRPFSDKKGKLLDECLQSILSSFDILKNIIKESGGASFKQWTDEMVRQGQLQEAPFFIERTEFYKVVEYKIIKPFSPQWKPRFTPQATIQHSLSYSIPLYFSLFGFNSPSYMFQFSASLPVRDAFLKSHSKAQEEADSSELAKWIDGYSNKLNGLVFLHALTLVQMTPDEDTDDTKLLEETRNFLDSSSQVDPKLKLTLMSRRPFSAMWQDLKLDINGTYYKYFEYVMSLNSSFKAFHVPTLFNRTNYAEQFYGFDSPRSLMDFLPCFDKKFYETNQEILKELLKQGVLSTTMIRNFRDDALIDTTFTITQIFANFYENAINSVQFPQKTYIIDLDKSKINYIPSKHDTLSPPCFLDSENSMGKMKEEMPQSKRKYGEAIIEVRAIRDVQPWFLKRCGLEVNVAGDFLARPDESVRVEAGKLFNFLKNFGTSKDCIDIYYLGIPFTLNKFKLSY
jgi:hypothetical protein